MKSKMNFLKGILIISSMLLLSISRYSGSDFLHLVGAISGFFYSVIYLIYVCVFKEINSRLGKFSLKSNMGKFAVTVHILAILFFLLLILSH